MTVSEILRLTAMLLRDNGVEHPGHEACRKGHSCFICDILQQFRSVETAGVAQEAQRFLIALGMGTGFGQFGLPNWSTGSAGFTLEQQHQRMAWLFFAADLADELGTEWTLED